MRPVVFFEMSPHACAFRPSTDTRVITGFRNTPCVLDQNRRSWGGRSESRSGRWSLSRLRGGQRLRPSAAERNEPQTGGTEAEGHVDEVARLRRKYAPSLSLGVEDTVEMMLLALRNNNEPYFDFGIEVVYRFAGRHASPFSTSHFFGRPLDLGQFERFRRVMNTEKLRILVGHTDFELLSRLDLSETRSVVRTRVANSFTKREAVFQWTLEREIGGRVDGVWFCSALICDDDGDGRHVYGVI